MNYAYRLVKRRWASTAFDGEGSKKEGGRWHSVGQSCVYLSQSPSLALLEIMVKLEDYSVLRHYKLYELRFYDEDVAILRRRSLPKNWRACPPTGSTARVGDQWLAEGKTPILSLPSAVLPSERNYLLNPRHPSFAGIVRTAKTIDLDIDSRFF